MLSVLPVSVLPCEEELCSVLIVSLALLLSAVLSGLSVLPSEELLFVSGIFSIRIVTTASVF